MSCALVTPADTSLSVRGFFWREGREKDLILDMKIGRVSIDFFRNFKLGSDFGKPVIKFYIRFKYSRLSIHLFTWCLSVQYLKKRRYAAGETLNIGQFKSLMQSRGVDISKGQFVEISVNGITPIEIK